MGVPPRRAVHEVEKALAAWSRGEAKYELWEQDAESCRREFAGWLGVDAQDIALLPSVVPAAAALADALAQRSGHVIAHRAEYRSLLLPFLSNFGEARIRWVDGPYISETFAAGLKRDTSTVIVSSVSSADGARLDLLGLADACAQRVALIVDATQSLGTVGLGVPSVLMGAVLVAGYKGLLGPRGAAYAYIHPDLVAARHLAPSPYGMADTPSVGPYGPPLLPKTGASHLDQSPAWLSWIGALPALRFLRESTDAERERQTTSLADLLRVRFQEIGVSPQQTDLPSPIVSIETREPNRVVDALATARIRAAVRRGRIRFGFHVYNTIQDVDDVLAVLTTVTARPSV